MATARVEHDISSFGFWRDLTFDQREETFAKLRAESPISRHRPLESHLLEPEEGARDFWGINTHELIQKASRDTKTFSSASGIFMEDFPDVVIQGSLSFIVTDAPRHKELRGIVWSAFTPGNMRKLEHDIAAQAKQIVDEIAPLGEADLATTLCKQLPGRLFANLFGIPPGDLREEVMQCAEDMASWSDEELRDGKEAIELFGDAAFRLNDIALDAIAARRENPQDDLLTWVCQAQTEDGTLEDWEVGSFFALLSAAANDTTRHTIAHTIWNFERFPEQKQLWQANLTDATLGEQLAEEAVRYATPLLHFRRTVTQDVEFGGVEMKAGDKVALWYCSGNRDEQVFDRPMEFDITREVNRHVGFGGGGPHYCMGAALARLTLRSIFREIYSRMPDIRVVGTPRFLDANVVHGVKELRAEWTPER
ncbi:cytochrome P450 [Paraconexibacter algicola]|uniref:Cytochrome P450 n=1 Tax=Paraconexibacter algicola TaxID=2133960 RepID=A0A2T4UJR4_9ACTN|nr:cytochrome P450 [Paraconexibacter algicola]PTL59486.1 cytochrome P450 [Paraconexibacter algicola]